MKWTIIFLLTLGAIACKSNKKANGPVQYTENQTLIQLETSPCRGYCPVFKLKFSADGRVGYEGIRFVRQIGSSTFQLTPDELKNLKTKLTEANLWQYPESFPVTIVDAPGAAITIYKNQEEKTIQGSVERPKPIRDIQDYLIALATAHSYNLNSHNPDDISNAETKAELLVKLKPEINAGNWLQGINNQSKANLQLIRRVNAENIWVLAYDSAKFSQEDILTLLKSHEHVLEAQPNRKAKERE